MEPVVGSGPRFQPGDVVRTLVGRAGDRVVQTEVIAPISRLGWHAKRGEATYYLSARGRRPGRWYFASELALVAAQRPLFRPDWLAWNEGTVVQLARAITDGNDLGLLPILADALEEAGCDNPILLAHCRQARGPWVADLILGEAAKAAEQSAAADRGRITVFRGM